MSFNNSRNSETKQRFTIKKFKIGTASVLIGTVFAVNGAVTVVSADETTTPAVAEQTDIKQVEESAANVSNSDDQALGSDSLTSTEDTAKEASELTAASETDNKEENVQLTESDTEKENTSNLDNQTTDLADDENAVEVQDSKEQTDEEANSNDTVLGTETLDGSDDSLGDEDSTETREVKTYPKASELPTLTRAEAESLNKEIIWLDFSDSKAEITGIENVANGSTVRPAIRAGATYKREIAPGYIIYVEFLNTLNINGVESSQDVIFDIQSERWSHLSQAGMKTGNKYTNITTFNNNANIGITLRVTATYNDKPVSPTVIVADGEEAGATEYIMFKTDGTPWDLLANVKNNLSAPNYTVNNSSTNPLFINENTENGGLGTQVFGPITNKLSISSTPIVSTAAIDPISGVTLSVYMDTTGKQSFQIGFVTRDTGDAPESYGGASHKMADADNPYLGTVPPDMDEGTLTPWTGDDNTLDADEGITQLTGLSENDSKLKVSAEGETFVLPVITNLSGTSAAYVHAWIDFNNNGKFDNGELIDGESGPEEGSAIVNAIDGTIELVFPTTAALESYKGIDKLGVRVRIAKNQSQIESPTGAAESGEVEDFQLNIKKGNVKVNFYLVGTTTEVSPSVYAVEEGLVGKRYSTLEARQNVEDSAKDHAAEKFVIYDADGKVYERVNVVGAEEGKITNSLTEVTYYYKLAQKDVIARFVTENEDGSYTTIEDSVLVKENEEVGVDYDASSRAKNEIVTSDGKTYTLREDRPENEKGKVKVENVVVTYIYDEVKANVTVNYVDDNGEVIKDPVLDLDQASTGTAYDTTDKAEAEIVTSDGKTYALVGTEDSETGRVSKGGNTVTYTYREVKADVTVNYVDESGNEIKSPVTVKENVSTGTAYDTTDKAEAEIVTSDGKTYALVGTKDSETGTVSKDGNTVTYNYREVKANVTVNYVDDNGEVIKNPVLDLDQASTGTAYDTTDKADAEIVTSDGKTYALVGTEDPETGTVSKGGNTVIYTYREVKADVTVNYVDESGNEIKSPVTVKENVSTGTAYDTTDKADQEIVTSDGKTYALVGTEDPETGTVSNGGNTVTYTYREVTSGITVNFLDQDGNPIAPSQIPYDHVSTGLAYDTSDLATPVIIAADGKTYRLVTVPNNAKGTTSKEDVEVTYVYEEVKASVTVNYVDESGNEIKSPITVKENVSTGTAYDTTDEADAEIVTTDGKTYQLDGVESTEDSEKPETGRVDADGVMVTYTYSEVKPDVTVNYVDESGNEVKSPVTVKENVSTGTAYGTTDKADPEIITADGKTYALVGTEDLETGTVSKDGNTVTYTYREVTSGITVNFLDQDGNPIASSQTPYDHVSTGLAYDTNNLATPVITTADGKTYRLVTVPDNAKGTTSKEDVEVTFIYEDVTPQISSLRINFVDESGKPLLFSNLTEVNVGDNYDTSNDRQERIVLSNGKVFELIEVQGSEEGNVSANGATVTYVYREVKANLTVNFVTTDGSTLRGTEVTDHSIGEQYDLSSIYPEVITIDGKEYRLIRVDGNQTGNIQEGDNIITYIYEEVAKEEPVVVTPENPTPAKQPVAPSEKTNELPQTGEKDSTLVTLAGLGMLVGGFSLLGKKRKEEE